MMRVFIITACLAASLLAPAAHAQTTDSFRNFTPSSDWSVSIAENTCILRRDFEDGTDKIRFELRQYGPWIPMAAVVVSNSLKRPAAQGIAKVQVHNSVETTFAASFLEVIAPEEDVIRGISAGRILPKDIAYTDFSTDDMSGAIFRVYLASPPLSIIRIDPSLPTRVTVRDLYSENVALVTGNFIQPIRDLLRCSDGLISEWGVGIEAIANLKATSKVKISKKQRKAWAALNLPGSLDFWLVIDENGNSVNCVVDPMSSAPRQLQAELCDQLPRSGHQPAISKEGKRVKYPAFASILLS